jgi:penicillin-binding protein 1A
MLELGMISPRRYDRAASSSLGLDPKPEREQYPAAHFVDYVKLLILHNPRFGTATQRYNFLFKGGLRIYTTIDLEMQRLAESAVDEILSEPGDPHGALTAVDPSNGHIRAMVGGRNYFNPRGRFAKVNLATGGSTGRQAGSAFKPFALVAALEQGILPSKTYVASAGSVFTEPPCGSPEDPWNVENYEGSVYGSMTMESATINSVNQVYAQIIEEVGPANVVDVARRMGIRSRLRPYCSSVLGTNEVNTLEMASAFGTLAMNGRRVRPIAIERIEDSTGRVIYEPRIVRRQVVNPQVAWMATQILRKVVLSGTGYRANLTDRQVAGKTGTAQMWRDAWFVGFLPQLSAAVWVGHPQGQISMTGTRVGNVVGGSFPASIWHSFLLKVIANMHFPTREFREPASAVISLPIDVTQGCVAVQGVTPADHIRYQQFVPGSQPPQCSAAVSTPEASSTVPSVIGFPATAAYSTLTNAGFNVTQSLRETDAYPSGTVLSQSPAPGSDAALGSTVSIVVAS